MNMRHPLILRQSWSNSLFSPEGKWKTWEQRLAGWNFSFWQIIQIFTVFLLIVYVKLYWWFRFIQNCEQVVSWKRCQPCLWPPSQLGRDLGQNDGETDWWPTMNQATITKTKSKTRGEESDGEMSQIWSTQPQLASYPFSFCKSHQTINMTMIVSTLGLSTLGLCQL